MKRKIIIVGLLLLAMLPIISSEPLFTQTIRIDNRSTILSDYEVHAPILIESNEDFAIQGWPGNGTIESPYILEYLTIVAENSASIMIHDTTAHFVIRNCWLGGEDLIWASHGIEAWRISNGLIENNTIHDFWAYGIFLGDSFNNIVDGNNIYNEGSAPAICIRDSGYKDSINNTIQNNRCQTSHGDGIQIHWSGNSLVIGNNCSYNEHGYGIHLYDADNTTILGNVCNYNANGIGIANSQNVISINNTLGWNINNNAIDDGVTNSWDDGISFGNVYGDYRGEGIYVIAGSAGLIDSYPCKADMVFPILDDVEDFTYEFGDGGNSIIWNVIELHPDNYLILKDGVLNYTGVSYTPFIEYSVNGLFIGIHNFTLVVYDTCGNSATDSVLVTVVDTTLPQLDSPIDFEYEFNITGNFIIWGAFDFNPHIYVLYINGGLNSSGDWDEGVIVIDIDGLSVGLYNYTLLVNDTSGNAAIDTVIVLVTETAVTTTTTTNETTTDTDDTIPWDLILIGVASIGGVCGIIALVVVIRRRK